MRTVADLFATLTETVARIRFFGCVIACLLLAGTSFGQCSGPSCSASARPGLFQGRYFAPMSVGSCASGSCSSSATPTPMTVTYAHGKWQHDGAAWVWIWNDGTAWTAETVAKSLLPKKEMPVAAK